MSRPTLLTWCLVVAVLAAYVADVGARWIISHPTPEPKRAIKQERISLSPSQEKVYYEAMKQVPLWHSRVELKFRAQFRIDELIEKAEEHYDISIGDVVIRWASLGTWAGRAPCGENAIYLNELLFFENYREFMRFIIPHEIAHVVECKQRGHLEHHMETWLSAMRSLSDTNTTATEHNLNTTHSCELLLSLLEASIDQKITVMLLNEAGGGKNRCFLRM